MNYFKGKNPVFIVAEIGGNHEGDFTYAKKLIRLASESGADAVKLQVYKADALVNPLEAPKRNKHFKKFELDPRQYVKLAQLCRKLKVFFIASVWDSTQIEKLNPYISIYKIGSGDLTAYRLINKIVRTKKPVMLSCGLASTAELSDVVSYIKNCDPAYISEKKLAVLQCTAMYPTSFGDANLNIMTSIKKMTGLPVGYSDHTVGMEAAEIACAMGAEILEKHFTDSRAGKTFRDHKISATKKEIQYLIKKINRIKELQGSFEKVPLKSEIESGNKTFFRRAVYPAKDLCAGTKLRENDLMLLRPNRGIDAREVETLCGKKLKVNVKKYQRLRKNYVA